MTMANDDWEKRIAALWSAIDAYSGEEFVSTIDRMAAEQPVGNAIALFERGAAQDSTGNPDKAIPLYEAALDAGLVGERRRRAVIQMASSLRNLGRPRDALDLLTVETTVASDDLDGAVATFRALTLADLGREREALAIALTALSTYLPRYNRSVARYAQVLLDEAP